MTDTTRLERSVLDAIARTSRDQWASFTITELLSRISNVDGGAPACSHAELVDAIVALEADGQILIQKWAVTPAKLVPYDRAFARKGSYISAYFLRDSFQLRLTHEGRKAVTEAGDVAAGAPNQPDQMDDLLPLYRRKVFDDDLTRLSGLAAGGGKPLSLVIIDIDHFKAVNDTHGHPVGDQVLKGTSEALRNKAEGKGRAYRYGGEELALLLPNYTPVEAATLAEVLRAEIEKAAYPKGIRITVSLGVASIPAHAANAGALLKAADDALLQAKRLGRNLVRVSGDPESRPTETRVPVRRQPQPSEEQEILQEAARAGGQILWVTTDQQGGFIAVGEKTFPPTDKLDMYESKKAREKLRSLHMKRMIELVSRDPHGGRVYELTVQGFEAAGRR